LVFPAAVEEDGIVEVVVLGCIVVGIEFVGVVKVVGVVGVVRVVVVGMGSIKIL
jgi:hypothetical protein